MIHVGATGTKRGATPSQLKAVTRLFTEYWAGHSITFHHGDCIGVDAQLHTVARRAGWWIVGHPPDIDSKRAHCVFDEERPALPYLDRNGVIAAESAYTVAVPKEDDEIIRSGTWATIRRFRALHRPIVIISRSFDSFGYIVERWPVNATLPAPPSVWG